MQVANLPTTIFTMGDTDITPPIAPPKKKSLFKRKISDIPDKPVEDGVEFFSRAKDLFPIRVVEEEKRRLKKLEKVERKRSTASAENTHDTPEKRRRVSSNAYDDEDQDVFDRGESNKSVCLENYQADTNHSYRPLSNSIPCSIGAPISGENKSQGSPESLSKRYTRTMGKVKDVAMPTITSNTQHATAIKHATEPISISDDDDDFMPMIKDSVAILDDDEPELQEVEELPHLVAKARERQERLKALERRKAKAVSEQNQNIKGSNIEDDDDIFEEGGKTPANETPVEILVTSMIPNTTPLIVRRKLYQPLKVVREVWVDKFIKLGVIPESMKNSIMLTWRQKQLFDVSTCESLCLPTPGSAISSEVLDENGRLHLEIWTHELLQEYLRKLAEPTPEPQQEAPVVKYKILLKGVKDKVPVKLKCAPSDLVQKLVDQYRKAHGLPDEKEVILQFEGDKLDPNSMVSETVLGEEDADGEALQVECYVN